MCGAVVVYDCCVYAAEVAVLTGDSLACCAVSKLRWDSAYSPKCCGVSVMLSDVVYVSVSTMCWLSMAVCMMWRWRGWRCGIGG